MKNLIIDVKDIRKKNVISLNYYSLKVKGETVLRFIDSLDRIDSEEFFSKYSNKLTLLLFYNPKKDSITLLYYDKNSKVKTKKLEKDSLIEIDGKIELKKNCVKKQGILAFLNSISNDKKNNTDSF